MKIFKWTLTLFFCLAASLYAADWTGYTREPERIKKIDGKLFYLIANAEELAWFTEQVNIGRDSINAVLVDDIKFVDDTSKTSSVNWTPIGKDSSVIFNGIFDGAGRTIYGLYCNRGVFVGLFGVAGENATIKNVKLAKSSSIALENNSSKTVIGGIAALNFGIITNCINSALITTNGGDVGGIVGRNFGTISDCMNSALITTMGGDVGGIACRNFGTISGCMNGASITVNRGWSIVGGIVGENSGVVESCVNGGSIVFSQNSAGGIAGKNAGMVKGCINNGSISSSDSTSWTTGYIGGVAGTNEGTVKNCINNASIYGSLLMGGIVGWNKGIVSGCVNGGLLSSSNSNVWSGSYIGGLVGRNLGTVENCRNLGNVLSGYGEALGGGGVVGRNDSTAGIFNSFSVADSANAGVVYNNTGTVGNCYYDSDILTDKSTVAPDSGISTSDMQSDRFAWVLNTTNGSEENSGVWSRDSVGYPIFADSLYKSICRIIFKDDSVLSERYSNYKGLVAIPVDPEPPEGKRFWGLYTDDGVKVEETSVFTKDLTVRAIFDSTEIPQISCSSSSEASSSSGKSSSSSASSSSLAKSSSSSAGKNSSSSSEPSDALVANLPSPTWSVTASGRNFQIHVAPVGKPYALFDLQGKVLAKGRIGSPEMTILAPRAGSYIVRIGNHSVRVNAR